MTDHHHFSALHVDNCNFKNPGATLRCAADLYLLSFTRGKCNFTPRAVNDFYKTQSPPPRSRWHLQILPINKIYHFSTPNCYIMFAARLIYGLRSSHVCQGARQALQFYWINTSHFRSNCLQQGRDVCLCRRAVRSLQHPVKWLPNTFSHNRDRYPLMDRPGN